MGSKQTVHDRDQVFARRVMECRQALGMSQTELAEALMERGMPCHQQTVGKIERGSRYVHVGEACIIAEVLGVELVALAELSPLPPLDLPGRIARLERAVAAARGMLDEVSS